jgi:Haem-binding domain
MTTPMSRPLKVLVLIVAIMFAGIQVFRPDRTSPPSDRAQLITSVLPVPASVQDVLVRSCYDCHSYQTRWPWYSLVAPVSWLTANDVSEGRHHLNFSTWASYSAVRAADKLETIAKELSERGMPPIAYTLIHRNARLSDAEVAMVVAWANEQRKQLTVPPPGAVPR